MTPGQHGPKFLCLAFALLFGLLFGGGHQELDIGNYEGLSERCDAATAASARVKADLRATEQKISDLSLLAKHTAAYRKLKPTYDRYKAAKDKEKFLRGFESEIILFEASTRALKEMGVGKLPSAERLKADMDELAARKAALQAEHGKAQKEAREYDTLRQNVDILLSQPKEQNREKSHELE